MNTTPLLDVEEIKRRIPLQMILQRTEYHLQRVSGIWKGLCPFHVEKTPSFCIYDNGSYHCFGCGAHGDIFTYYMSKKGWDFPTTLQHLAKEASVSLHQNQVHRSSLATKPTKPTKVDQVDRPIPQSVKDSWEEGREHLQEHVDLQEKLGKWRGWPPELVATLAADGVIATPLYHGKRGVAFRVEKPMSVDGLDIFSTEMVGYHIRLKPQKEDDRPQWRFIPNEKEHGQKIAALPFVFGDFSTAKLCVITEGQWDAITFCHAAGWLSHDTSWLDDICVLGLRGAQGINVFFRSYLPYWPRKIKCLLLPDDDKAGSTWFTSNQGEKSFAERLIELCVKVIVQKVPGAKDFNEAWLKKLILKEDIGKLFLEKQLMNEGGLVL